MDGPVGILLQVLLFGTVKTIKAGFLDLWIILDLWHSSGHLLVVTIVVFTISQTISGCILELVVTHTLMLVMSAYNVCQVILNNSFLRFSKSP